MSFIGAFEVSGNSAPMNELSIDVTPIIRNGTFSPNFFNPFDTQGDDVEPNLEQTYTKKIMEKLSIIRTNLHKDNYFPGV